MSTRSPPQVPFVRLLRASFLIPVSIRCEGDRFVIDNVWWGTRAIHGAKKHASARASAAFSICFGLQISGNQPPTIADLAAQSKRHTRAGC